LADRRAKIFFFQIIHRFCPGQFSLYFLGTRHVSGSSVLSCFFLASFSLLLKTLLSVTLSILRTFSVRARHYDLPQSGIAFLPWHWFDPAECLGLPAVGIRSLDGM
jgi:hypothetical protein